jgi:cytochrome c oxidase subunit 3
MASSGHPAAASDPVRNSPFASGNNDPVTSTAAPQFESSKVHSLTRPNLVSVGTIVWLSSELMFFAGLFAMYFTVRAVHANDWPMRLPDGKFPNLFLWHGIPLYALPFTIVLVASSFTCQWGVFAAEKGDVYKLRRWFTITFFMGAIFVGGQVGEYILQVKDGNTISATGYGSVFFLTTGFHMAHVIGGLIAFIYFLIRTTLSKFTPAQATAAIVVSYYWHFVDVVWIALFATIYLIR